MLKEGCGCGCGGSIKDCGSSTSSSGYSHGQEDYDMFQTGNEEIEDEISKEDALDLVSKIASLTSCPMTKNALMKVVSDLSGGHGEDLTIHHGAHPEMDLVSIIDLKSPCYRAVEAK